MFAPAGPPKANGDDETVEQCSVFRFEWGGAGVIPEISDAVHRSIVTALPEVLVLHGAASRQQMHSCMPSPRVCIDDRTGTVGRIASLHYTLHVLSVWFRPVSGFFASHE